MIVNLNGTNGSGKSTVVRELLMRFGAYVTKKDPKGKPLVYCLMQTPIPVFVIGRYETACGGCDTIHTVKEVINLVDKYQEEGDVLFEGILISTTLGAVYEYSKTVPNFVHAFMSTVLDECERRVKARRVEANNMKPFNPEGLCAKFRTVQRKREKLVALRQTVRDIKDYKDMAKLLGVEILL